MGNWPKLRIRWDDEVPTPVLVKKDPFETDFLAASTWKNDAYWSVRPTLSEESPEWLAFVAKAQPLIARICERRSFVPSAAVAAEVVRFPKGMPEVDELLALIDSLQ